jgi:hypothetical protein
MLIDTTKSRVHEIELARALPPVSSRKRKKVLHAFRDVSARRRKKRNLLIPGAEGGRGLDLWYMVTRHVIELLYPSEAVFIAGGSFFGAGPVASVLRLLGERGRGGRTARSVLIPAMVVIGAPVALVWRFAVPIANMLIVLATWLKGRA